MITSTQQRSTTTREQHQPLTLHFQKSYMILHPENRNSVGKLTNLDAETLSTKVTSQRRKPS